jgi:hypothetical protein
MPDRHGSRFVSRVRSVNLGQWTKHMMRSRRQPSNRVFARSGPTVLAPAVLWLSVAGLPLGLFPHALCPIALCPSAVMAGETEDASAADPRTAAMAEAHRHVLQQFQRGELELLRGHAAFALEKHPNLKDDPLWLEKTGFRSVLRWQVTPTRQVAYEVVQIDLEPADEVSLMFAGWDPRHAFQALATVRADQLSTWDARREQLPSEIHWTRVQFWPQSPNWFSSDRRTPSWELLLPLPHRDAPNASPLETVWLSPEKWHEFDCERQQRTEGDNLVTCWYVPDRHWIPVREVVQPVTNPQVTSFVWEAQELKEWLPGLWLPQSGTEQQGEDPRQRVTWRVEHLSNDFQTGALAAPTPSQGTIISRPGFREYRYGIDPEPLSDAEQQRLDQHSWKNSPWVKWLSTFGLRGLAAVGTALICFWVLSRSRKPDAPSATQGTQSPGNERQDA